MANRRRPTVSLVRTGYKPAATAPALPSEGKGEPIKIEPWGPTNQQPQEIVRIVYDSGTAEMCLTRLAQFIGGKGFASEATAKAKANPQQTFNQLLAEAKHYAAMGIGVSLAVRYTFGGEPAEVYVVETDVLRREKNGPRWVHNYQLAKGKMPAGDNRVYLGYDPVASADDIAEEVLAAALRDEYWGHLYYSFEKRVARNQYAVPGYYAAKEDLESDAELSRYDRKTLKNGFFPDSILKVVGSKYNDEPDPDWVPGEGQTDEHRPYITSPDMDALRTTVKDLKGSSTEASVMILVADKAEEMPEIDMIDKGPNSKGLTDMTARIEGKVYRRMGVPPVLCGVAEPGVLGSNQQIVNSIKLFGLVVEPARALITEPLQQWFPHLDFTVAPLDPVDYIDPAVLAKMTDDEIRAIRGLPPIEKPQDTESEKLLKALNSLSPIIATKVLDRMSDEQILGLVGLEPSAKPKPKPNA
ncbi:hypothetical protein [Solirubrum puertoriconensis]|uniref:Portal protein n=1 Tax=Solirubrum puertoriconensis TaxID=1751427 RepID=A0A9X0HJ91_SOLP1|nr:hypothetical protein [Solirubrum puertoriconensis]KUG06879.1 hypothetical protein ASU33_06020 [Solirubrum puertoriconensis]